MRDFKKGSVKPVRPSRSRLGSPARRAPFSKSGPNSACRLAIKWSPHAQRAPRARRHCSSAAPSAPVSSAPPPAPRHAPVSPACSAPRRCAVPWRETMAPPSSSAQCERSDTAPASTAPPARAFRGPCTCVWRPATRRASRRAARAPGGGVQSLPLHPRLAKGLGRRGFVLCSFFVLSNSGNRAGRGARLEHAVLPLVQPHGARVDDLGARAGAHQEAVGRQKRGARRKSGQ